MLPTAATSLSAAQLAHVLEKYTYFLMTGTRVGEIIRTWPTCFVCELLKAMSAQKKQVFFCVFLLSEFLSELLKENIACLP